jgi:hypothetical protein
MTDLSMSIVNEFSNYDFTDGSIFYYQKFVYIAVPKSGVVLMYNMTNPQRQYWEAPQSIPVASFSVINGALYGHGYLKSETYQLFTGFNDLGAAIPATARFSYNSYGARANKKGYTEMFVEGYISGNTTLSLGITYELDGCATSNSFTLNGSNSQFVCVGSPLDNDLGKYPLGESPIGTNPTAPSTLPPHFTWIKTFNNLYFIQDQITFTSNGIDQRWELLCFGPSLMYTHDILTANKD